MHVALLLQLLLLATTPTDANITPTQGPFAAIYKLFNV